MVTKGEKYVLTWNIRNPTNATIYTKEGDYVLTKSEFGQTFAHEFGHCLGLGDAYNAGNRGGTSVFHQDGFYAPSTYEVIDPYGNPIFVRVPNGDIMLDNQFVTDNDIRMVLEAYRTGEIQTFPYSSKIKKNR